ncbi:MAG TPA: sigma factor-like helix-turn-helix DNA-binding protein [Myxococcales bacterium]|nr:sigma factor-like helix-turn-helix DNA-binding protein [Myxococcales bacterium]
MSEQVRSIRGAAPVSGAALRALSDESLARRARSGDGTALVKLALRHWKGVYRTARNMLVADAAEAAEEAFRRALFSAQWFPDGVPFRLSLYRAAVADALTRLRSSPVPAKSRAPISLADRIREALGRLDAMDRACYVLRDVEDLSPEEAAFVLRTSAGIVRQRAHRARLMVIGWSGEHGSEHAGGVLQEARSGARSPRGR